MLPDRGLQSLATTFNMSVPDVEKIICNLIERRQVFFFPFIFSLCFYVPRHLKLLKCQVAARLDSVDKLLIAHNTDHRDKALMDITAAADARIRVARGKVVAANMARLCQMQAPR
jgi:hypothetical protein